MSLSSPNANLPTALALKQGANWQCQACGKQCRHHQESLDDFAIRMGYDLDVIEHHPRRWTLHVTRLQGENLAQGNSLAQTSLTQGSIILCGSCHRKYHNHRRWQQQQQQQRQQQEQSGQLTLNDICLPLAGLQLPLDAWATPYEIVNPQSRQTRRKKSPLV